MTTETRDTLELLISRVSSQSEVKRAILFGSRSRGDATADSDFDICLIVDDTADTRALYIRIMREVASADWSVDLLIITESDFARKLQEGWTIMKAIAREGRLLYAA